MQIETEITYTSLLNAVATITPVLHHITMICLGSLYLDRHGSSSLHSMGKLWGAQVFS